MPNVYFRKKPATIIFNLTSPLHQEKKYKSEGKATFSGRNAKEQFTDIIFFFIFFFFRGWGGGWGFKIILQNNFFFLLCIS